MGKAEGIKQEMLRKLRTGQEMSLAEQVRLVFTLSLPAILAQFSTILMQYIDASMVGSLGAGPSASIGLVSTTTWIFGGFCMATSSGFSVQVAHLIGAGRNARAREILREALLCVLLFSAAMAAIGLSIAGPLPRWLGGEEAILSDATGYFFIYSAFLPFMQMAFTCGSILQASGNMKVPARLNVLMCFLDVAFNYLFIFVLGMGVRGAALGTGMAELVTAGLMFYELGWRSEELCIMREKGSYLPEKETLKTAFGITSPMWLQNIILRGAHICSTVIVAPLGMVSIAANSFAIIAESFCYMPGYGMEEAATTLVGQSIGASRKDLARRFGLMATALGAGMMTVLAAVMFIFAPQLMDLLSNDPDVIALGARCLRLEAFAETMYGVSIVAYGACVGAGDTLVPSIMNFGCMWVVRIGLALLLTPKFGLMGYWIAMCADLNVRGVVFLTRILGRRWLRKDIIATENQ